MPHEGERHEYMVEQLNKLLALLNPSTKRLGIRSLSRPDSADNTSNSRLDVGTFCLNQYNPCVLQAHHLGQTRKLEIY